MVPNTVHLRPSQSGWCVICIIILYCDLKGIESKQSYHSKVLQFSYQTELAGFYRDANVGFVTPLRDGMNLVAKEFVACQVKEPGVLVLSPFAGAGETMLEALRVNPYEIGNVANVLHRALSMPKDEREVRMNALR